MDKPFLMPIEDVFTITGRGTVVTGKVEQGVIHTGDEIEIVGLRETQKTTCTGVEMFRKLFDEGQAGDNIGALLRGTDKDDVERGQVLCAPGSITPHTDFEGQVYILTKDEGGRHKPFFNNYRPQFFFRTTDVTGTIQLPAGTEMVMPGDNVDMTVELGEADRDGRGVCGSRSVRVAAPSAPAASPRSSSDAAEYREELTWLRASASASRRSTTRSSTSRRRRSSRRSPGPTPRCAGPIPLPTDKHRYTVIRGPARRQGLPEHFEMRDPQAADRHRRIPNAKTIDSLQRIELPAGVDIEIKIQNG